MVFSVQCLAHQPQGLLNVICNEKQVGSGRWHTLAIGRTVAFEVCLLFYFLVIFISMYRQVNQN
jgi:hypothetical protein